MFVQKSKASSTMKKNLDYKEDFLLRKTKLSVKQELCIYSKNKLIIYGLSFGWLRLGLFKENCLLLKGSG